MIVLRHFTSHDAAALQRLKFPDRPLGQVEAIIAEWETKTFQNRYLEMLAILRRGTVVGTISLYQHSKDVVSLGPEVFPPYRRQGFAREVMLLAMELARAKGYQTVSQQIRADNAASIALHRSLGFQTDGSVFTNGKGNRAVIYVKPLS